MLMDARWQCMQMCEGTQWHLGLYCYWLSIFLWLEKLEIVWIFVRIRRGFNLYMLNATGTKKANLSAFDW